MLRTMVMVALSLALAACGKGLDRKPDLSNLDAYREKIEGDVKEAKPSELEAFNFAVSNVSFDELKQKYAKDTYRDIAKKELTAYIKDLEARIAAAERKRAEAATRLAGLQKIKIEVLGNKLVHDTFFDKWDMEYEVRITNGTDIPLSQIEMTATMGINGEPKPLYEWSPSADFKNGLKPGESTTLSGSMVGFLSFDKPITLAVRESTSRQVKVSIKDAADFSNKWVVGEDGRIDLLPLQAQLAPAKAHLTNL